jgi:Transposase DDE domain
VSRGTIVDATIINAPGSTKNHTKARDPEMQQTKKGHQWYFGMKAHIGVDSRTNLIQSVAATPANGWTTARYCGLAKYTDWFLVTRSLTDLYLALRRLVAGTSKMWVDMPDGGHKDGT